MAGDVSSSDRESNMQYFDVPKGCQNSRHFTQCQGLCIVDQNERLNLLLNEQNTE